MSGLNGTATETTRMPSQRPFGDQVQPPPFKTFSMLAKELTSQDSEATSAVFRSIVSITLGKLFSLLQTGQVQYYGDNRGSYEFAIQTVNSVRKNYSRRELNAFVISDEGVLADANSRLRGLVLRDQDGKLSKSDKEETVNILVFQHKHFLEVYRGFGRAKSHSNQQKLSHPALFFYGVIAELQEAAGPDSLWYKSNDTVIAEALTSVQMVGTGEYEDARGNSRYFDVRTLFDHNGKMLDIANLEAGSESFHLSTNTKRRVREAMTRLNGLYNLIVNSREAVNGNGKLLPMVVKLTKNKSIYKFLLSDCLADNKLIIDQINDTTLANRMINKAVDVIDACNTLNCNKAQGSALLIKWLRTRAKSDNRG